MVGIFSDKFVIYAVFWGVFSALCCDDRGVQHKQLQSARLTARYAVLRYRRRVILFFLD